MSNPKLWRTNIEEWRLPERAPSYTNGSTLHARMAARDTGMAPGGRSFLSDADRLLAPGELERDLGGGITATRSAEGGLILSSGGLRRALAAADTDARTKLKPRD